MYRTNSLGTLSYRDVNAALPSLASFILDRGEEVGSRQGEPTSELLHAHVVLANPLRREVIVPGRGASLPAQIAETLWVLAGRNDIEWLSAYLPRAADFSDDGETWRGGYGPRLRAWPALQTKIENGQEVHGVFHVDQLAHVVELLTEDRSTRRAVMSIYDPARDSEPGKDIPCNDFLMFVSRGGALDLHVTTRSNDLWWGWSGINAFEWSALLEVVARLVGAEVGELHFTINSLHLYGKHWKRARELAGRNNLADVGHYVTDDDRTRVSVGSVAELDRYLHDAFTLEARIRETHDIHLHARLGREAWTSSLTVIEQQLDRFPEPMIRSWLRVLAWWWLGEDISLDGVSERLRLALAASPASLRPELPRVPVADLGDFDGCGSPREPELVYYLDYDGTRPDEPTSNVVPDTLQRLNPETGQWEVVGRFTEHDGVYTATDEGLGFDIKLPEPGEELVITTEALNDRPTEVHRDPARRIPRAVVTEFVEYVSKLHAEKHAAYGDSWKRRGELISILANLWRKVDRLGVNGAGETAADTAVDLLVYLIKYRLWLSENANAPWPSILDVDADDAERVARFLNRLGQSAWGGVGDEGARAIERHLTADLAEVERRVTERLTVHPRVGEMILRAFKVALWHWANESGALHRHELASLRPGEGA